MKSLKSIQNITTISSLFTAIYTANGVDATPKEILAATVILIQVGVMLITIFMYEEKKNE